MHFVHLYFLPEHFARRAVRELDREPRELKLADRTYFEDARVAALCRSLALERWDDADGRLRVNETAHEVLSLLLRGQSMTGAGAPFKGGLAPAVRRRVRDYIDTYLAQPMTLGELAQFASLSEYHFSRMFSVSFGRAPHAWIAEQRLARARTLLRTTSLPLAQVAAQCGYANAVHLSHRFRDTHGATPGAYRRAMQAAQQPAHRAGASSGAPRQRLLERGDAGRQIDRHLQVDHRAAERVQRAEQVVLAALLAHLADPHDRQPERARDLDLVLLRDMPADEPRREPSRRRDADDRVQPARFGA